MGGIRRAIASVSSPLCGNHFLVCTFAVKQGPNVRMSGFLPSTIDTIGGGVSTQRKNMNTKKYLKPPLSIDNIALHMIATNFNPLQPEMIRLFWMDLPAKRRYKRKRVWFWDGLFQWPCLLCMSQNLGMSLVCLKKLPQKLTPLGWKTCTYHLIWEKNTAAYRLAPKPTPLNMNGLEPKKSPNGQLRRNIFVQIPGTSMIFV